MSALSVMGGPLTMIFVALESTGNRQTTMRSQDDQMLRAHCNAPTTTLGLAFNPALRFVLRDEAWNMVTFAVGPGNSTYHPEADLERTRLQGGI